MPLLAPRWGSTDNNLAIFLFFLDRHLTFSRVSKGRLPKAGCLFFGWHVGANLRATLV